MSDKPKEVPEDTPDEPDPNVNPDPEQDVPEDPNTYPDPDNPERTP